MGCVSGSTKAPPGLGDGAPSKGAHGGGSRLPRILDPLDGRSLLARALDPHVDRAVELVDRLAGEVVLRHAAGRVALDLGHGAPRVTEWVRPRAAALTVVDAVDLGHGAHVRLPFPDETFELVYSLRTLAHLGHDDASSAAATRTALAEIARVLVPGGTALCQIDNPRSLFGAVHGIRHPIDAIERGAIVVESERGITRFETLGAFLELVPPALEMTDLHGLRVFTALPRLLVLPIVGRLFFRLEWFVRDRAPLRMFGAHLVVVLRRL
jgi:SAM-dependent methyltransferase